MDGTIQSDGDQTKKRAAPLPADYPDKLKRLLDHPLLADVSREPTMDEIDTLIAVETGSALVVTVRKLDGTTLEVPVRHTATVHDLIVAVQKAVQRRTLASHGRRYISWRRVWRCFCLSHRGTKMLDPHTAVASYGITTSGCEVDFVHHIRQRD